MVLFLLFPNFINSQKYNRSLYARQVKMSHKYYKKSEDTYVLLIYVSEDLKIRVSRLGEASFKDRGLYLYWFS